MTAAGTTDRSSEQATQWTHAGCPGSSPVAFAFSLLALVTLLGCAHQPPSPLSEATKAHLGIIGVVAAPAPPEVDYPVPGRGGHGGAAIGAAKGLGVGMLGAVVCTGVMAYCAQCLEGCAVAAATPYFAARYAVDQATAGVPADTIVAAETAIHAVLAARNPQAVAQEALYRVATAQTGQTLVLLPNAGSVTPPEAPRYPHLAAQGIDTVLELTVQRIAWRGARATGGRSLGRIRAADLNPALTLVVTVRTRVLTTTEGTELYGHTRDYVGRSATFTDWGATDAQLLRDELDQLFQEMAGEIIAQVFGVAPPPAPEPEAPTVPPSTQDVEPPVQPAATGAECAACG